MSGMKQKSWSNRRSVPRSRSQFNWTEDFAGPRIKTWLSVYMAKLFCINCGTAAAHWMSLTFPVQKKKCAKRQKQKQLWLLELWKHNTTTAYLSHLVDFFKRWLFDSVKKISASVLWTNWTKSPYLLGGERPLDLETCIPAASSGSWELHMQQCPLDHESCTPPCTIVLSIMRAANHCPVDLESCIPVSSRVSIMRAEHQCPLDHESWTPVSSRSWDLNTSAVSSWSWELHTSVLSIMRAAHYHATVSSRSWELQTTVLSIMRPAHVHVSPLSWDLHPTSSVLSHYMYIMWIIFEYFGFWNVLDYFWLFALDSTLPLWDDPGLVLFNNKN
jgi:hypothetical protein